MMPPADLLTRHNVHVAGQGPTLVFGHGYGCDQSMWRLVVARLSARFRTVVFDHVGAGGSRAVFDRQRYGSLEGYAEDLLEVCAALGAGPVVFVGHSVGSMIGVLAAARQPERFSRLVLIGPSPRYIDDAASGYTGGFAAADIEGLLRLLEADQGGWAAMMAPLIMGNPERPELAGELAESFCRMAPEVAQNFARITFTGDNRADLARVRARCLVLQCRDDAIAPPAVGDYVQRQLPDSRLLALQAGGHCPHLSAPQEIAGVIEDFLVDLPAAA